MQQAKQQMQQTIQTIIRKIHKGCVFDAHYVISRLIKDYSDVYLAFASKVNASSEKTKVVHRMVAEAIDTLDARGIISRQNFESWSENIHHKSSACTCWRKL